MPSSLPPLPLYAVPLHLLPLLRGQWSLSAAPSSFSHPSISPYPPVFVADKPLTQGEQIAMTHLAIADIDRDLSVGEKLLGSLGCIFSSPWNPRATRSIKGPVLIEEIDACPGAAVKAERLGLEKDNKEWEDNALSYLSNLLGELKEMALDMRYELERQNKAMSGLLDVVNELNFRVRGANQRGRRLLGK